MAPRGSRLGVWQRLAEHGHGSLLILLYSLTIVASVVLGIVAGPVLTLPFLVVVVGIGVVSPIGTGLGWKAIGLTGLVAVALGSGAWAGEAWSKAAAPGAGPPRVDLARSRAVWADAVAVARDFPACGVGLGAFPAIEPYYKTGDLTSTTARSSVLQWWAEAGVAGLVLTLFAGLWVMVRLPVAVGLIGSADRALGVGLIGSMVLFGTVSLFHWSVELPAIALAAAAVAATADRWLAGGTDLFVEHG